MKITVVKFVYCRLFDVSWPTHAACARERNETPAVSPRSCLGRMRPVTFNAALGLTSARTSRLDVHKVRTYLRRQPLELRTRAGTST